MGAMLVSGAFADGPEDERQAAAPPQQGLIESLLERAREAILPKRPKVLPPRRVPGIGFDPPPIGVARVPMERPERGKKREFSVPEVLSVQEHRIRLAVQEGVLGEEEAKSLREGLETVLEEQGIRGPLDPHPDRMWKELLRDAEIEQSLSSLPAFARMTDALERLEEDRKERLAAAAGELALAWIDDLLLVPEEDRRAWSRGLARWASVEGFTEALEEGRTMFFHRLPSLSLPTVDPDLIRTGAQGVIWKTILTGKMGGDESGDANPYSGMDARELMEAHRQLNLDRLNGRIELEEFQQKLALIRQAEQAERIRHPFRRREFDEADWKTLRDMAQALLERYGETLGVLEGEAARHHFSGTRGALRRWMEKEGDHRRNMRRWGGFRHRGQNQPEGVGIWDVDAESLVDQPIYQKLMRDVLSPEAYAGWRREMNRRRSARIRALREFAVASMDLRLQLSPRQRERARAVSLGFEDRDQLLHKHLMENVPEWELSRFGRQFNLARSSTLDSIARQIARDLESGPMTFWQRREVEVLRKEMEE